MSGIVERIQAHTTTLTQSEALLVRELMRAPREIALATSADFAARVGVHEATTSRLAKKLEFPSYAAFRDALRDEFLRRNEPADRFSTTLNAAEGHYLTHLIDAEMAALKQLLDHVNEERIRMAASALHGRRIFIFAQGHATALAALAERRFLRMGIETRSLQGNARDLAEQSLALGADDAVLIFAFRRQPAAYRPLVELSGRAGAQTVVISDAIGPALSPAADRLLAAPRSGLPGAFQTLTVPMLILNALILAIGAHRGVSALEPLERLGDLIEEFEKGMSAN